MTDEKKKTNPLAQAFAATESDGTEESGTDFESSTKPTPDLSAIADTDIGDLSAIRRDAARIMTRTQDYIVKDADDVKTLLQVFDSIMQADKTLDSVDLFNARDYVQKLMVTLKECPEFSTILTDRDCKNFLSWSWAMYDMANENLAMAEDKATRPKASKTPKTPKTESGRRKKKQSDALMGAMTSLFGKDL